MMTAERFIDSTISSSSPSSRKSASQELTGIVAGAVELWDSGVDPDAGKLIESYPQFREHPSLALELLYEEYCRHRETGREVDISVFCQRFSWLSSSLRRMIEVHDAFEEKDASKGKVRWPREGEEVCGFVIVAPIGIGSFSRVYVANQTELGNRLVTIKVAERIYDEARLMARLSHEAIVPVLSVHHDRSSGLSVICMPYRGAATLEDVLNATHAQANRPTDGDFVRDAVAKRNQGLPAIDSSASKFLPGQPYWQLAVRLALPIVEALEWAHLKGIIHRDIKPSNVMLAPPCHSQLLDFNLSTDMHEVTGRVGGTVSYMPIEQLEVLVGVRKSRELTPAVDVYAFGVVLYELLTGRLPFEYREVRSLSEALIARRTLDVSNLSSPRNINDAVPASLDAIVMKCLRDAPAQRPTPTELRANLDGVLCATTKRASTRRRAFIVGTAAVAGSAIGGLLYRAGGNSAPTFSSAPTSFEELVIQANNELLAGRVDDALEKYKAAYREKPNSWLALGIAECLTRQQSYLAAKQYWELAKPAVAISLDAQNNQAFCLIKTFDIIRARKLLENVVARQPQMQAAWLNRALSYVDGPKELWQANDARESIARAIEIGPVSAQLYLFQAQIAAMGCNADSTKCEAGVDALQNAIHNGLDPRYLDNLSWITALKASPRFPRLLTLTPNARGQKSATFLAKLIVPYPFPDVP